MQSSLYASYKTIENNQNTLTVFNNQEFGEIRTLKIDNEPWFVGKDVAIILGYAKPQNAISTHVDEDDTLKQGIIDKLGREQQTIIINESGLYSLILSSKLPSAKRFKRWVTSEVLPQIRRTGGYIPISQEDDNATIMAKALLISQKTIEKKNAELKLAEDENLKLSRVIEGYKPKVEYVDEILSCNDALLTTNIAFDYGLSAQALNKILCEERVQRRVRGQYILYADYLGKGYTKTETKIIKDKPRVHTLWTQKGRMLIHEVLKSRNIRPLRDLTENVTQLIFN